LHPGFERLIGAALIDERTARELLADPVGTALRQEVPAEEAARLAGIRAGNLPDFARAVRRLAYGIDDVWGEYCLPSVG
jgi:hypothetical protein